MKTTRQIVDEINKKIELHKSDLIKYPLSPAVRINSFHVERLKELLYFIEEK